MDWKFRFLRETNREMILPVTISIAQERLKIAFNSTITTSKGFLYAKYEYNGRIDNNELDVEFTVKGKSIMYYGMHGKLFGHPKGSRLVMTVADKNANIFFIAPGLIVIFYIMGTGVFTSIFLAILFTLLSFGVINWHRNSAADALSELIYKIIYPQL